MTHALPIQLRAIPYRGSEVAAVDVGTAPTPMYEALRTVTSRVDDAVMGSRDTHHALMVPQRGLQRLLRAFVRLVGWSRSSLSVPLSRRN